MRTSILCVALLALLAATPVAAAEDKCPLDLATCLDQFGLMRERPWLGIEVERDSTGLGTIVRVVEDGPAARGGLVPGDVIERVDGMESGKWIAGKAGWKTAEPMKVTVRRQNHPVTLEVPREHIPEDVLASLIGVHMLEGHLAYMGSGQGLH